MEKKTKVEKVQDKFINMLCRLQEKQIESMKPATSIPGIPPLSGMFDGRALASARPRPQNARTRKPTKKQLDELKKGRQKLAAKNRQEIAKVLK